MSHPPLSTQDAAEKRDQIETRRRWALLSPALTILLFAASGPLLIVLIYSFLTPGDYGDVIWKFSTDGWFSVFMQRDIFDGTLGFADAHLSIFWAQSDCRCLPQYWRCCLDFQPPISWPLARQNNAICGCS